MTQKEVRRGYVSSDEKEFSVEKYKLLYQAAEEMCFLLNRGYPIKSTSTFVGNHYLLSERQRLGIVRSISSDAILKKRRDKEVHCLQEGQTVWIDGLNLVITLETILSGSLLIQGMDGAIRDLAGIRGTYRLIPCTNRAILLLGDYLEKLKIGRAVFFLDAPVSNTGRLKVRLQELLTHKPYKTQIELVPNADVYLKHQEGVISSDAIVIDASKSWFNLSAYIMSQEKIHPFMVSFKKLN